MEKEPFTYLKSRLPKIFVKNLRNKITFASMTHTRHFKKIIIASLLLVGVQVALASSVITGRSDDNNLNSKFSLKDIGNLSRKNVALYSFKSNLQFNSMQIMDERAVNGGLEFTSVLNFNRGNSSYVIPFHFKVKVPKFKTPSPIN
jgi:hypothetical protein